jgi:hypothetical protein
MKLRVNKRLIGLMLAPFALLTACVGLSPEEQAEYSRLQSELQRIQFEDISPRKEKLRDLADGKLVVDVDQLHEQVNQIRNEKLAPLQHKLAGLKSQQEVLAAPGTRIDLEELNRRLVELDLLSAGIKSQIAEYREQLELAKGAAASQVEAEITLLEVDLAALREQLAAATNVADENDLKAQIAEIEAKIHALREESEIRNAALSSQFGTIIHDLEMSLHDISEEKSDIAIKIHDLELSAPEELEQVIIELESMIEKITTSELRPLIERLNAASSGGDGTSDLREQLRAELEEWLARVSEIRARINELQAQSLQSILGGLDLSGFVPAS